jgi:mono/diheme cytochrome c family protein
VKILFSLLLLGLCLGASRSVWDGVYSKEQAARGATTFNRECSQCHGLNLLGGEGAPELAGDSFVEGWSGRSVGDLFEFSRLRMPPDDPGSLSREEYSDVIAYILSVNKFPAGQKNLETEAAPLKEIRIEKTK